MKHPLSILLLALLALAGRPAAGQGPTGTVLSLSDIHFGPPDSLKAYFGKLPVAQWEEALRKYGNDSTSFTGYGHDTNYWLLHAALTQMRARCPRPDFIVITGDLLDHRLSDAIVDSTSSEFGLLRKINEYLAGKLAREFPGVRVLPGLGNNDTDRGDDVPASHAYRRLFAEAWAPALYPAPPGQPAPAGRAAFIQAFAAGGYYRYPLAKGRSLLMLNSVPCMPANDAGYRAPARRQLDWLRAQLAAAPTTDRLWLAMHVPPGIDTYKTAKAAGKCPISPTHPAADSQCVQPMWQPGLTYALLNTLATYGGPVGAGLAGHTHMDEVRLLTSAHNKPVSFIHVTPSVSPYFQNNPAFQVLRYDSLSLAITNYATYYLNLFPAPGAPAPRRWRPEYAFDSIYHVRGLAPDSLARVWRDMAALTSYGRQHYAQYFNSSAPPTAPTPTNNVSWPYYWCAIGQANAPAYCQCVADWRAKNDPIAAARPRPAPRPARRRPRRVASR